MPKPTKGPRLGGSSSHQKAMLANLATSLFEHGRIKTTETKARALRPYAEKLITHAKKGTLHNRREVLKKIRDKDVVHTLFAEIGPFFADRNGGYTRIIKVEARKGDNAPMAVIELVQEKTVTSRPTAPAGRQRRRKAAPARRLRARHATAAAAAAEEKSADAPRSRRGGQGGGRARRPRPPRPRLRSSGGGSRGRKAPEAEAPERPTLAESDEDADKSNGHRAVASRLRLDIAYDGTEFAGWAVQAGQRTVAGGARRRVDDGVPHPVQLRAAGRTDAGVHATGQVAHVDVPGRTRWATPIRARRGPATASSAAGATAGAVPARRCPRVRDIVRAPAGFDARFSALRRHYVYRLSTAPYGVEPQEARFVTAWPRPLDVDAMAAASRELLGLHDFAAFCRHREGATTIRDLQRLDWSRDGDHITAYVTADAFCWSMVRSLVGALLAVGEHRREPAWCAGLLTSTRRSSDFAPAPPHGLTLVGVDYPPDDQLEARTKVTRDLRVVD